MILCLDIGNTHIFGGLFDSNQLMLSFRAASKRGASSDELGLFFRGVLRENNIDPGLVTYVSICSVVPEMLYPVSASCSKYFGKAPFELRAGAKTGLKVLYRDPREVGSDRIANAIAATRLYPARNLLIVDLGTATTVCAVDDQQAYMGGVIMPGLKMSMQALEQGTSKLGSVEIVSTENRLGRTTASSIQTGLYRGHLGALREIITGISKEHFAASPPRVVATGGFARLFENAGIFDEIIPDLVLRGLLIALELNLENSE